MAHAIQIANDSDFGLGACAWTNNAAERDLFIDEIESGLAFINGMVASDPRIPWGREAFRPRTGVEPSRYSRVCERKGGFHSGAGSGAGTNGVSEVD